MPELPEVETICRQLSPEIVGKKITRIVVNDKRVVKNIGLGKFTSIVKGKTIRSVDRRGKMIICSLTGGYYLLMHLRISGWLLFDEECQPYARVLFELNSPRMLQFCDSRVLGEIKLVNRLEEASLIRRMGPEPLELSKKKFLRLFESRTTKIKSLLMDQFFIAGIGNIYAQEALFCAGIHPERKAHLIKENELTVLYCCLRRILMKAIAKCGTSANTYKQINGSKGSFFDYLKVYQRQGKPCVRCKGRIVKKMIAGRGTCFCPVCQN